MTDAAQHDKILIIDFGSQVTQLIARRVREAGVYCEIAPFAKAEAAFDRIKPVGVIFSGGPSSVYWTDAPRAPAKILGADVPILGICYGNQTMVAQLGGAVEGGPSDGKGGAEFGRAELEVVAASPLFAGVWSPGARDTVWMSHGDKISRIPDGFNVIARSDNAENAVIANETE